MPDKDIFEQGLTEVEIRKRLEKYGENKLAEKRAVSWVKILTDQFKSPLIYILVVAGGITLALGDVIDAGVIGAAVVLNTILGFYQEMKAEKSLEALSKMLTPKAKVMREGKQQLIEASQVVPGDICFLEIGERVPADGVIIKEDSLSIDEAMLTGESVAVEKILVSDDIDWSGIDNKWGKLKNENKVFMGTTISSGIGKMLVVKTGKETEIGRIAEKLTKTKEEKTPLQKQIEVLSKKLAIMVAIISLIILTTGLLVGDPFIEIFTTAVAIAVSAIPEGLAVSLTVILAIGMQRIFKRKALVRKLVAAETLGSVTVICADKTGTLTEGKMRVVEALTSDDENSLEMLRKVTILCNDMRDPLEIGMMDWAKKNSKTAISIDKLIKQYPRLDEIPFDPRYKYIATLHSNEMNSDNKEKSQLLLVSGAPEIMLNRSKLESKQVETWLKRFEKEARKGRRLVGFAYKQINKVKDIDDQDIKDLKWLGILVYEDPIREGVKEALKATEKAGIKVKVITGDYRVTAEAIINQLEVNNSQLKADEMIEGDQLDKISDQELSKRIDRLILFARTSPEQKLRIVKVLQEKGEVVAMTGDGVNDAPALKKADIGIVVETASAVAKETADMILLDSNFATIVAAIEEGRGIFVNLRKIILYLLSDSFAEVILVLGSMLMGIPLPISAAQILWINLVDDGLPDFALTLEPKPDDLMKSKPQGHQRVLLDQEIKLLIGLISGVAGILSLLTFWFYWKNTGNLILARSVIFAMLGVDSLIYVFSCKTLKKPLWQENIFDNLWLIGAVMIGLSFQLMALYLPGLQRFLRTVALGVNDWLIILAMSVLLIAVIEGVKWRFNHLIKDK